MDNRTQKQATAAGVRAPQQGGVVTKIDALYSWLSYDLQRLKTELCNELKYSAMQSSAQFKAMQEESGSKANENAKTIQSMAIELKFGYKQNQAIYEALSSILTDEVLKKLDTVEEKLALLEAIDKAIAAVSEKLENFDVNVFADTVVHGVVDALPVPEEIDYDKITDTVAEKTEASVAEHSRQVLEAVAAIPLPENVDYSRIVEEVGDKMLELLQETQPEEAEEIVIPSFEVDYDRIIYGAAEKVVESLPYPEKLDYNRVEEAFENAAAKIHTEAVVNTDEVVEKVLAGIDVNAIAEAVAAKVEVPAAPEIDYDRLSDMIVAKLPAPEKPEPIDYDALAVLVAAKLAAGETTKEVVLDEDGVNAVAACVAQALDIDAIAAKVAEKLPEPTPVDVDAIAAKVVEQIPAAESVDVDAIVAKVVENIPVQEIENIDYDKVCQAAQAAQIIPDPVNYDRIGEILQDKLDNADEDAYDIVIDDEGIRAIAEGVADVIREELLSNPCEQCELANQPVQEEIVMEAVEEEPVQEEIVVEEAVEEAEAAPEPVEEVAESVEDVAEEVTETVEEVVEPAPEVAEEVVKESVPAETKDEIAAAVAETFGYDEVDDQLVDAETGLVVRLKKSFIAKMKQSTDEVKDFYGKIKNELDSYKRLNSNVSWHGDRFNFGRDTVAKMNICGKTLCLYLALDPNDPEIKSTVYHQKDVGSQKAYESTPLMVKVKSGAAVKKAIRLVVMLAEKLGAEKEEGHEDVNYVEAFSYESTKQLLGQGLIKVTKEKKVDLNF